MLVVGLVWFFRDQYGTRGRAGTEDGDDVALDSNHGTPAGDGVDRNPFLPRRWLSLAPRPEPDQGAAPEHFAVQAGPEPGETTPGWAKLPKSERVAQLRAGFDRAIDDLEAGKLAAEARAVDSLSALRSELYDTPEGRAEHAALEAKLEAAMENR